MSILIDSHIHTSHSPDGISGMEGYIQEGSRIGLTGLCFTEHIDLNNPEPGFHPGTDLSTYRKEFLLKQEKDETGIDLRFGLEVGLLSWAMESTRSYVKGLSFDYVIASNHWLEGFPNMEWPENWRYYTLKEVMRAYASQTLERISAYNDFDCVGHLTYFARYAPDPSFPPMGYHDASDELDALFSHLIHEGKGLEINTSTYLTKGFTMPDLDMLTRYRELGGEIVAIGSDAHESGHLGRGFPYAQSILEQAGFTHYTIFRERKPCFLSF